MCNSAKPPIYRPRFCRPLRISRHPPCESLLTASFISDPLFENEHTPFAVVRFNNNPLFRVGFLQQVAKLFGARGCLLAAEGVVTEVITSPG
jgi:hypothetical protein